MNVINDSLKGEFELSNADIPNNSHWYPPQRFIGTSETEDSVIDNFGKPYLKLKVTGTPSTTLVINLINQSPKDGDKMASYTSSISTNSNGAASHTQNIGFKNAYVRFDIGLSYEQANAPVKEEDTLRLKVYYEFSDHL